MRQLTLKLVLVQKEIEPPAKAPNKLAKTSAEAEPRKTASGLFEVPLIVNVANCVLSPNSATNTVIESR